MKYFGILLMMVLILASSVRVSGAAEKRILDRENTLVLFNVSYLIFARVGGRFDDFKGSFIMDRQYPEKNYADISIQTTSVNTGFETRDAEIRSLFNTSRYPIMLFHSNMIEIAPDNTGQITGYLTLRGITRPVMLDLVKVPGKDRSLVSGYKITGKIKRSDFGMDVFSRPIGNTVSLLVCYNMEECTFEDIPQESRPQYN